MAHSRLALIALRGLSVMAFLLSPASWGAAVGPQPGDVYREYRVIMTGGAGWRVTDPHAPKERARQRLPNPVHRVPIDDLTGARRAEVTIDRWGGHVGTSGKMIRFNEHPWIALPEVATTPAGESSTCYVSQDNPVVEVPLTHLREGVNVLEGLSGDQTACGAAGWGQWGWYGAVVRIYFGADNRGPTGRIVSPRDGGSLGEYPQITVSAAGARPISRIDVLAHYRGYDENGDGRFTDWHGYYRYTELTHHVGTALDPPYRVVWDTRWVPDQAPRTVKLVARIRDAAGLWTVTPVVSNLTLRRVGSSVRLYEPQDVPARFQVRKGLTKSSAIHIPAEDDLAKATEAAVHIRSWNGTGDQLTLGAHRNEIGGADHNFAYSIRPLPVSVLESGENRISFHSATLGHSREISWPGPAVTVRYGRPPPRPRTLARRPENWLDADYAFRVPLLLRTEGDSKGLSLPASVPLDFTKLMATLGRRGELDPTSVRLVGVHGPGSTLPRNTPQAWQFEPAPDFDARRNARGTLTFLYGGPSPAEGRAYLLYFGLRGAPFSPWLFEPQVTVTDHLEYQGQDSFRIATPAGTYHYHKEGGGFAGLTDREGHEWIGYRPGGKAAGEFRGIPNLGQVGHPGYSGERGVRSRLLGAGPLKATILSESADGRWRWTWEIFPALTRLSIARAGAAYWFLYEGTPGGRLDPDQDFVLFSNGETKPLAERWNQDLPGPEWVAFGDPKVGRALFVAKHDEDEVIDQYFPKDGAMTVFGFGRRSGSHDKHLTGARTFSVGLLDWVDADHARAAITAVYRGARVELKRPEARGR